MAYVRSIISGYAETYSNNTQFNVTGAAAEGTLVIFAFNAPGIFTLISATDTRGNTWNFDVKMQDASGTIYLIWTIVASGKAIQNGDTITFNHNEFLYERCYSGTVFDEIKLTDSLDLHAEMYTDEGNPTVGPTIGTTYGANSLYFAAFGYHGSNYGVTGAGYTNGPTAGFDLFWQATQYKLDGSAGETVSASRTGDAQPCAAVLAVFKNAAATPPVEWSVDFTATLDQEANSASVVPDVTPATGRVVIGYSWDFGDGSESIDTETAVYVYPAAGVYVITLTVTDDLSATHVATKTITIDPDGGGDPGGGGGSDMADPTIVSVSPLIAKKGDTLTVTGTNFGATAGTLKIGDISVTCTGASWTDTSLTGTVPDTVVAGANNIVVTTSATPALTVTAEKALVINDPSTNNEDLDDVVLGRVDKIYIDGVHVGYCEKEVTIEPTMSTFKYRPHSTLSDKKTFIVDQACTVKFTMSQINAKNLAIALGQAVESDTKTIIIKRKETPLSHSLVIKDKIGVQYSFPSIELVTPTAISIDASTNRQIQFDGNALPVECNSEERFGYILFP